MKGSQIIRKSILALLISIPVSGAFAGEGVSIDEVDAALTSKENALEECGLTTNIPCYSLEQQERIRARQEKDGKDSSKGWIKSSLDIGFLKNKKYYDNSEEKSEEADKPFMDKAKGFALKHATKLWLGN